MKYPSKSSEYLRILVEICILTYVVVLPFNHRASLSAASLIVLALCWIALMAVEKRFIFRNTILNIPLGLVLLIALISSFFSIDVLCSLDYFRSEILKSVFIFFAIINFVDNEKHIKRLAWFLMFSFILMNLYGLAEYFAILKPLGRKLDSTLGHHNKVGMFADLVFPIIFLFLIKAKDWKMRIPALAFALLSLVAIIFTQSRGAWVSISLAIIVAAFLYDRKMLGAIAVVLAVIPLLLPVGIMKRIITIFDFKDYMKPGRVLVERPFVWKGAIKIIKEYPIIGAGTGSDIFYKLYVEKGYKPKNAKQKLGHAHNQILETLVENGIVGLIAQILFFTAFFRAVNRGLKENKGTIKEIVLIGCFAGILAILFHGVIGSFFRSRMMMLVMIVMGLAVSCTTTSEIIESEVISISGEQWERKEQEKKSALQV